MFQPKLLPWIAKRHGIPLERVRVLWEEGIDLADLRFGEDARSSDYWAYAMECVGRFAACEGRSVIDPAATEAPAVPCEPRSALPVLASQHRLGGLAFDAASAFIRAANEYWRQALLAGQRH